MIVSGTAGAGKSYLIHCLRQLLGIRVQVIAPNGVAAFNVEGCTLHSSFELPIKGELKHLDEDRLRQLQQHFTGVEYIIIDEVSMVGRKMFGTVDQRLHQAFPHRANQVLGGCSCLLISDLGQLPPVMDLPLYTTVSWSSFSNLGRAAYQCFNKAVVLDQVMRQSGTTNDKAHFRDIFLRLRNAEVTTADWHCPMTHSVACASNRDTFTDALHLHPTVEAVVEHNVCRLLTGDHPVAQIKAVHSGPNADKANTDDAGGLEAVLCIAQGARVMLTANLWADAGLVNGAKATVQSICYQSGGPPALPICVMVRFDIYSGPTLSDGTVPIVPLRRTWISSGTLCSRLQLPLKLAWAVTIHKAQGLTLQKAVVDVGVKVFSTGLTFVATSCVRHLSDLPFSGVHICICVCLL